MLLIIPSLLCLAIQVLFAFLLHTPTKSPITWKSREDAFISHTREHVDHALLSGK
jgi:hypothetical protein